MGRRARSAARKSSVPIFANSEGWIEKGPKSIQRRAPLTLRMKSPRFELTRAQAETGTSSAMERR
jgi:hypothetical protein